MKASQSKAGFGLPPALRALESEIHACTKCPRLRSHCLEVAREKRRAYAAESYWGRPISGFGDAQARLVIIGLAPAAHGANRTGRIFTGDRSGDWLYRALHRFGFANQAESRSRNDGLELRSAWVTCAARCAPPENSPLPAELAACEPHLRRELAELKQKKVYLALGSIALKALWPLLREAEPSLPRKLPRFAHGAELALPGGGLLLMSYHPSQQNTFTGRLTEPMFDSVFARAREWIKQARI